MESLAVGRGLMSTNINYEGCDILQSRGESVTGDEKNAEDASQQEACSGAGHVWRELFTACCMSRGSVYCSWNGFRRRNRRDLQVESLAVGRGLMSTNINYEGCDILQSRGESQETRKMPKMLPSKRPAQVPDMFGESCLPHVACHGVLCIVLGMGSEGGVKGMCK